MKHKFLFSIFLICWLLIFPAMEAIAGSSFDFGYVEGSPPESEVNWIAWINESKNILAGGMPNEIMTEDNTASENGVDIGYSQYDLVSPEPEWILQVENFNNEVNGDDISMIFGGLDNSAGKMWNYSFTWDQFSNFETNHGIALLSQESYECPFLSVLATDSVKKITIYGDPGITYHIYKSTLASGASNGASNGRYQYLNSVTVDSSGIGSYSESEPVESWYITISCDETTGALDGCHSEYGVPTAVTSGNFYAEFNKKNTSVDLQWATFSEIEILGFNLYKSIESSIDRQKINSTMIPAVFPGSIEGSDYYFNDADVMAGKNYSYWLEVINIGSTNQDGPVKIYTGFIIYLPSLRASH